MNTPMSSRVTLAQDITAALVVGFEAAALWSWTVAAEPGADARALRVLGMLAGCPADRCAVVLEFQDPRYPGCLVYGVAIRKDDGAVALAEMVLPTSDLLRTVKLIQSSAAAVAAGLSASTWRH